MATRSLMDFDDDIESGETRSGTRVTIDMAIEQQLNELLKVNPSTVSSSNPTPCSSSSASLLDLNDNEKSQLVTGECTSNPISSSNTATCLLDLDVNGELCNATAEKCQPIQQKSSTNSGSVQLISNEVSSIADKLNTLMKHEDTSINLSSELKKSAILIPETDPDKSGVIVHSNAIGLLFEFAAKQKLKNPCFLQKKIDKQSFEVKCSFSGVEGEGMGRSLKAAKMQAAQNCLTNLNTAILNKQVDICKFKDSNKVTNSINYICKSSNAIGALHEHAEKFMNDRPKFDSREQNGFIRTYIVTCSYLTYSETSIDKSKQKARMEAATKVYEKMISKRR